MCEAVGIFHAYLFVCVSHVDSYLLFSLRLPQPREESRVLRNAFGPWFHDEIMVAPGEPEFGCIACR